VKVLVLGAGATGLAAAFLLRRAGAEVIVADAADKPGGLLATFDCGGGRLEYFYHHFFTHDAAIRWWLEQLGLTERVEFRPTTMGLARGGVLAPFGGPTDVLFRLHAVPLTARLRFLASSAAMAYLPGFADAENTPAMAWFRRWAGRAATDAIWSPLLTSKFGDAAESVPLAWMAGRLRQRARSRSAGGSERLGYLRGSLEVLVDRMAEWLFEQEVELRLRAPICRLLTENDKVVGAETSSGELRADAVLSTLPTPITATLVQLIDPYYAGRLETIRYTGAMCAVLALDAPLTPYYWLNVTEPGYEFAGVIEHTNFLPASDYGGRNVVYLSRYLPDTHPLWTMPEHELLDRWIGQLGRLVGRDVSASVRERWLFRGKHAAPVPVVGFHKQIPTYRTPLPGLFVAAMPHIYPDERSVNNSLRVAAAAVRAMGFAEVADEVPVGLSLAAKYGHG
jgi:protoporphyrinogen oxidase